MSAFVVLRLVSLVPRQVIDWKEMTRVSAKDSEVSVHPRKVHES